MASDLEREGILFCLCGPTGSGKSTFARKLSVDYPHDVKLSVSATSREPREGEKDGKDYFFFSREVFEEMKQQSKFFEWEENHGNYYGTLQETVDHALQGEYDLVLDIDIRGALNFRKAYPENTVITFLVPPSFAVLKERLEARGSMTPEEFSTRCETAKSEYSTLLEIAQSGSKEVDYFLVNDDLDETYGRVRANLLAERAQISRISGEFLSKMCVVA